MISSHCSIRNLLGGLLALSLVAAACGGGGDTEDATGAEADGSTTTVDTGTTEAPTEDPVDSTVDAASEETTSLPAEPAGPPTETRGFDGSTIKLGYITDQTTPLALVGVALLGGAEAFWADVNAQGGVGGEYQVELVPADGKDSEAETVQEYQRIKEDVVMIAQVLSTPPTQALVEFLEEDEMIAVPGSLAGQWGLEANLLPNGTAYEFEMINLADWYVNESGLASDADVFCTLKVDDKYGNDSARGVDHAGTELGFDVSEEQTFTRLDAAFTAQVTRLNDAGCTVVFTISLPAQQAAILQEAAALGFDPVWLGSLPSYLNLFATGSPELWENFYVALDTPNFDSDEPGMAKFNEVWDAHGDGNVNTFNLSGYFQSIATRALLEAAVAAGDLSPEGIKSALAGLGEVELDGLADNYVYGAPEDRIPAAGSRIYRFDATNPPNLLTEVDRIESALTQSFDLSS